MIDSRGAKWALISNVSSASTILCNSIVLLARVSESIPETPCLDELPVEWRRMQINHRLRIAHAARRVSTWPVVIGSAVVRGGDQR